jgi:HK97 family phage prohead protease
VTVTTAEAVSVEIRSAGAGLRAAQSGQDIVLTGSPIVYNTPYPVQDMLGSFTEVMRAGVAAAAMRAGGFDCRFLINHDGMPLARSANGTLVFTDTPTSLNVEAHLDARQQATNDLAVAVERGDVNQMSIGFMVAPGGDAWRDTPTGQVRVVTQFEDLFDVSAVTFPASPTTSIELARAEARCAARVRSSGRRAAPGVRRPPGAVESALVAYSAATRRTADAAAVLADIAGGDRRARQRLELDQTRAGLTTTERETS